MKRNLSRVDVSIMQRNDALALIENVDTILEHIQNSRNVGKSYVNYKTRAVARTLEEGGA